MNSPNPATRSRGTAEAEGTAPPVLEVEGLSVDYATEGGRLLAVRDVSLSVFRHQSLGLVGESGSGKSTLAMAAIGFLSANGRVRDGSVRLNGTELIGMPKKRMRQIWGAQLAVVSQHPLSALNPSMTIGKQLAEVGQLHLGLSGKASLEHAKSMLDKVAMPDPESVMRRYPHQLSGGMRQRCCIAMALTASPSLLVLDEPTTALDVTTQAVVLDLIADLKTDMDSAIVYITHDLGVVARICDRVGVMYAGELVEQGALTDLFRQPQHPYTLALLGCVPDRQRSLRNCRLATIPGSIPHLYQEPQQCVFTPRCGFSSVECADAHPRLAETNPGHTTSCLHWQILPSPNECLIQQEEDSRECGLATSGDAVLEADNVYVRFKSHAKSPFARRGKQWVRAVEGVSIEATRGRTLGVVGESGSGKTTLASALCGLVEVSSGSVRLLDEELAPSVAHRSRGQLRRMQMVFQNPEASLNPTRPIGHAVSRSLQLLGGLSRRQAEEQARHLLTSVSLPAEYYGRRPHELSGGEQQRVAIARAFSAAPDLVFCDEPLSSLDVSIQGSLMNLLTDLQLERGTSYVFISHDLSAVQHLSHHILVLYAGVLMETGPTESVLEPPFHPYTEALLSAVPIADPDFEGAPIRLEGSVPSALEDWTGCRFHSRCPRRIGDICIEERPPLNRAEGEHWIKCHWSPAALLERQQNFWKGGEQ